MKAYTTKSGLKQYKPSFQWIQENAEGSTGFCLACGNEQEGVEPDACKYECEACGAMKVYGAEELGLMGLYHGGGK